MGTIEACYHWHWRITKYMLRRHGPHRYGRPGRSLRKMHFLPLQKRNDFWRGFVPVFSFLWQTAALPAALGRAHRKTGREAHRQSTLGHGKHTAGWLEHSTTRHLWRLSAEKTLEALHTDTSCGRLVRCGFGRRWEETAQRGHNYSPLLQLLQPQAFTEKRVWPNTWLDPFLVLCNPQKRWFHPKDEQGHIASAEFQRKQKEVKLWSARLSEAVGQSNLVGMPNGEHHLVQTKSCLHFHVDQGTGGFPDNGGHNNGGVVFRGWMSTATPPYDRNVHKEDAFSCDCNLRRGYSDLQTLTAE